MAGKGLLPAKINARRCATMQRNEKKTVKLETPDYWGAFFATWGFLIECAKFYIPAKKKERGE